MPPRRPVIAHSRSHALPYAMMKIREDDDEEVPTWALRARARIRSHRPASREAPALRLEPRGHRPAGRRRAPRFIIEAS